MGTSVKAPRTPRSRGVPGGRGEAAKTDLLCGGLGRGGGRLRRGQTMIESIVFGAQKVLLFGVTFGALTFTYGYVDLVAPRFSQLFVILLSGALVVLLKRPFGCVLSLAAYYGTAQINVELLFSVVMAILAYAAFATTLGPAPSSRDAAEDTDTSGSSAAEREVRQILFEHAPGKLAKLPLILEKYGGDWEKMLHQARAKYVYGRKAGLGSPWMSPSPATSPQLRRPTKPMRQPQFDETPEAMDVDDDSGAEELVYETEASPGPEVLEVSHDEEEEEYLYEDSVLKETPPQQGLRQRRSGGGGGGGGGAAADRLAAAREQAQLATQERAMQRVKALQRARRQT